MRTATTVRIVALIVAAGLAFVGCRLWQYSRREPLREGVSAWKGGDYKLAFMRLEPFARDGDRLAQRVLGEMYARGLGTPIDEARATMWFRRAECGCDLTGKNEYDLALNLSDSSSTPTDRVKAVQWLQRAAEAGHPDAQRLLADPAGLNARGLNVESSVTDRWRRMTKP